MRRDDDAGSALIEFTWLAVLLMVPLVWVLLAGFQVQRAAFGVTEAARQAGRAYSVADDDATGRGRAAAASRLALRDQGIVGAADPILSCGGTCLAPGSTVRVTVTHRVAVPILSLLLPADAAPTIPVRATHTEVVDLFKAGGDSGDSGDSGAGGDSGARGIGGVGG